MLSQNQIEYIIDVAKKSGEVAVGYFNKKNFNVSRKPDNSEVTCADIEISKIIGAALGKNFSDIPVICEEGDLRNHDFETFFLIDPIDGTGSFAKFNEEFSINIALVKDKKVVFGLIYAPLFEGGKMIYSNANGKTVLETKSGERSIKTMEKVDGIKIVTSKRTKDEKLKLYMDIYHPGVETYEVVRVSSAVKFFYLIESRVNLYLHFRPSMEWDIASGHYLVELIGGELKKLNITPDNIDLDGEFSYNKKDYLNGPFVAKIT